MFELPNDDDGPEFVAGPTNPAPKKVAAKAKPKAKGKNKAIKQTMKTKDGVGQAASINLPLPPDDDGHGLSLEPPPSLQPLAKQPRAAKSRAKSKAKPKARPHPEAAQELPQLFGWDSETLKAQGVECVAELPFLDLIDRLLGTPPSPARTFNAHCGRCTLWGQSCVRWVVRLTGAMTSRSFWIWAKRPIRGAS